MSSRKFMLAVLAAMWLFLAYLTAGTVVAVNWHVMLPGFGDGRAK